jgi:molybdenum cofactor biosynthesis enzyme MoaA
LNREIYSFITGYDSLNEVIAGILASLKYGIKTKINVIYTKLNAHVILDFINFSNENKGIIIKFFDLLITNELSKRLYLPLENLTEKIEKLANQKRLVKEPYLFNEYVIPPNAQICIKIASTQNNCPNTDCYYRDKCLEGCLSSIRISQDGILQPCGVRKDNAVSLTDKDITIFDIRKALKAGGKLV